MVEVAIDVYGMRVKDFVRQCEDFEEITQLGALREIQREEWEAREAARKEAQPPAKEDFE